MRKMRIFSFIIIGFLFCSAGSALALDSAVATIQNYGDRLVNTMRQGSSMSVAQRYQRMGSLMNGAFDFGTMIRLAVGAQWNSMSAGQRTALREAFAHFTAAYYASRMNSYNGETVEVDPTPVMQGGQKIVKTQLISGGNSTQINYLMGGSRVIDVYLDGSVSEVATRRAEFAPILADGGADALIATLKAKTSALLGQ